MKSNENRKTNRNRSLVALFVLCSMFAVTLVGCQKTVADNTEPSMSEEVSESISQVELEEVSEEISEEVTEQTMDLTPYTNANGKFPLDLVNDMDYDEFKVIVWKNGEGAKTIISNGDSYQMQDSDDFLYLYYPNKMQSVQSDMDYVRIEDEYERICTFNVYGTGDNIEVTFTGTDVDGKEHAITIYVTKDWKYEWE